MLAGQQEFVLVDDQKVVYETALSLAKCATDESKQVVIVQGGPGTGKSVVAINLLVALTGLRLRDPRAAGRARGDRSPRHRFSSEWRCRGSDNDAQILQIHGTTYPEYRSLKNADGLPLHEVWKYTASGGAKVCKFVPVRYRAVDVHETK